MRMRARRPAPVLSGAVAERLLAGLPVGELHGRLACGREAEEATCIDSLERLGVRTLGELAALPAAAVADRFGELGLRALRLAGGDDEPLRPRRPPDELGSRLGLPEAASGPSSNTPSSCWWSGCSRIRPGATVRFASCGSRPGSPPAVAGAARRRCAAPAPAPSGSWLALAPRLGELPGPAAWLGLRALELGPEAGEQGTLARTPGDERRERLSEAVQQVRSAAGRDAVLRVLEVDPGSRVPERRAILAPYGSERDVL